MSKIQMRIGRGSGPIMIVIRLESVRRMKLLFLVLVLFNLLTSIYV